MSRELYNAWAIVDSGNRVMQTGKYKIDAKNDIFQYEGDDLEVINIQEITDSTVKFLEVGKWYMFIWRDGITTGRCVGRSEHGSMYVFRFYDIGNGDIFCGVDKLIKYTDIICETSDPRWGFLGWRLIAKFFGG